MNHDCGNGTCGTSCGVQKGGGPGSAIYAVFSVAGELGKSHRYRDGAAKTGSIPVQLIDPHSPAIERIP